MSEQAEWDIPISAQPKPEDAAFDLTRTLSGVLSVRTRIPPDAFTASILGTERAGNGILIREDGLVLTVGYLIAEASSVWLVSNADDVVEAHVVAYDHETGFGLVQALGDLGLTPIPLGNSTKAQVGERVVVAGQGGRRHALNAWLTAKREFAGYWEYLLDEAIFTVPAHPNWGGSAVLDAAGKLLGIGSLYIQQVEGEDQTVDGNLIVPIDLLDPILDDLLRYGRPNRPARPWLGVYAAEAEGKVGIAGVADASPADRADIHAGDIVLEVNAEPVHSLADMFRKVWAVGDAGVEVPLTILRAGEERHMRIRSADRQSFLKVPRLH